MAIGRIGRWQEYLDTPDSGEPYSSGHGEVRPDAYGELMRKMPNVYFHVDPESISVDHGITWDSDEKPKRFVPQEPQKDAEPEPSDMTFPHTRQADKGKVIKNFKLRFDDELLAFRGGLTTERSIEALHNMALPWDDPRNRGVLKTTSTEYYTQHRVFYLEEYAPEIEANIALNVVPVNELRQQNPNPIIRDPETGEIITSGRIQYETVKIDNFKRYRTSSSYGEVFNLEEVGQKLPPHPLELTIGSAISRFVCNITAMSYTVTKMRKNGKILAAEVELDLEEYSSGTLFLSSPLTERKSSVEQNRITYKDTFFVRSKKDPTQFIRLKIEDEPAVFVPTRETEVVWR